MNVRFVWFFLIFLSINQFASSQPSPGYEKRIRNYIDSLRIVDTHEHFFEVSELRKTNFLDFTLMLFQNSWDDLRSAGMPDTVYDYLYNKPLPAPEKWKIIEPWWSRSFNTSSNKVIMRAVKDIYGISSLNDTTVEALSAKMKEIYGPEWFNHILNDVCRFDFVLQESDYLGDKSSFVRYTRKFSEWLTVRSKYTIDSLAIMQVEPIYTLDDYVNSMKLAFDQASDRGMVAVKVNIAYARPLSFENPSFEAAKKVFRTLINGDESTLLSYHDAKPLQDYMLHQLLELAGKKGIPVAFHTGMQAGDGNNTDNSDPALLTNLFFEYPDIKFVLYHGSYPFGNKLSAIVKNFPNVYLDMNWTYSISPTYAENFLKEWLETVPASKIMAFGGDQRSVENTYGELQIAKKVISDVLISKVKEGYLSESEALKISRMILHDNAVEFYKLK
jgi:phage gp37-like protein